MFTILMVGIGEVILWVGVLYVIYRVIFYKSISAEANFKQAKLVAEKLALVKLHSKSSKDIFIFLENNAQYLSEDMINNLAEAAEILKIDEDLNDKFSNLETHQRVLNSSENDENDFTEFSGIKDRKI